jgi:hypothetical protein
VLFIEDADGHVRVAKEALAYTLQMIEGKKPLASARALCKTLGRISDLYRYVRDANVITEEDLVDIVYLYADYRLNGSKRDDGTDPSGLNWSPISWPSFVVELRHIADYSTHCAVQYGYAPLVPRSKPALSNGGSALRRIEAFKKPEKRGFFSHLAARREAWGKLRPQEQRPVVRHVAVPRRGISKDVVSEEFIRDLIDAETNPCYRMLWIMGAFGGPRLSEQLNLWVCDVRPPEARRTMFRDDSGNSTPLVVLANPHLSNWIGKHSWDKQDRTALLRDQYGLLPRPDCDNQARGPYGLKVARAGWKGMLIENDTFMASQVHWIDPAMGHEYLKLATQLIEFHRRHDIGKRHPWLMINTDERKPEVLGRPMTMRTVDKAWERACQRIGLTPYQAGRHKHGLRDFYKDYAEKVLGLSPVAIQIMMHHVSIESQAAYGKVDGRSVSDMLNAAIAARQRTLLISSVA